MSFKTIMHLGVCFSLYMLVGCSSASHQKPENFTPAQRTPQMDAPTHQDQLLQIKDPWVSFNKRMYRFNAALDEYVLLPAVQGYRYITPDYVEEGVHNVFNNIGELGNIANNALQFKGAGTAASTGRLVINSTVGLLGIFDVASHLKIYPHKEDFGQTLGYWGVSSGPYLVLPLFGPSSVRDAAGLGVQTVAINEPELLGLDNDDELLAYYALKTVDARNSVSFRYYESGSPYDYERVRLLYSRMRQAQIEYEE